MPTTIHKIRLYSVDRENAWLFLFGISSSLNLNGIAAL